VFLTRPFLYRSVQQVAILEALFKIFQSKWVDRLSHGLCIMHRQRPPNYTIPAPDPLLVNTHFGFIFPN